MRIFFDVGFKLRVILNSFVQINYTNLSCISTELSIAVVFNPFLFDIRKGFFQFMFFLFSFICIVFVTEKIEEDFIPLCG